MTAPLPTYEQAVAKEPWHLIASHLSPSILCALSRVSHEFHAKFSPFLWGSPADHFIGRLDEADPDDRECVYVALTRFKRLLPLVRLEIRALVHTLRFPSEQSELYQRFRPEWLRELLELLPNLQSLVVSRLPLFDHSTLLSLRKKSPTSSSNFCLRLLDIAGCQNTTSSSLTEAITHFPHLVYLDASGTAGVRDKSFLSNLRYLPELRVLKLQRVLLRDEDLRVLAGAIQIRIRSLDVRQNLLTDQSVPVLLGNCFCATDGVPRASADGIQYHSGRQPDPASQSDESYADLLAVEELHDESYDHRLARRLTGGDVKTQAFDWTARSGITHLRISDNKLSVDGIAGLIHSRRLCVLDAGSPSSPEELQRLRLNAANYLQYPEIQPSALSAAQRLIPSLEQYGQALTYLRIDQAVISEPAPKSEVLPVAFPSLYMSRPSSNQQQMGVTSDPPPYPSESKGNQSKPPSASSAAAPASSDAVTLLQTQRAALRQRSPSTSQSLLPASLPNLRTLVLTSTPCYEPFPHLSSSLTTFVTICASETRLADIEARLLSLPRRPKAGEIRSSRRRDLKDDIFPLKKLVLEMSAPNKVEAATLLHKANLRTSKFSKRTKASTEDQDSELFWNAAEEDFSFFDDGGERDLAAHTADNQRGGVRGGYGVAERGYQPIGERSMRREEVVDVVGEVARFRRERKAEAEREWKRGRRWVDGYWEGKVEVVRPFG